MRTQIIETSTQSAEMDSIYRYQRHVYDLTRKWFLLGRDSLLEQMEVNEGERVLEVGCGTGRNLLRLSQLYPLAKFYGLDVSFEMLRTAAARFDANDLQKVITLRQGLAEDLKVSNAFGLKENFDTIFYSYTLSMIPGWSLAINRALDRLNPGGRLYILDFTDNPGYLSRLYKLLWMWLEPFSAESSVEMLDYLKKLAKEGKGKLNVSHEWNGYAFIAEFRRY